MSRHYNLREHIKPVVRLIETMDNSQENIVLEEAQNNLINPNPDFPMQDNNRIEHNTLDLNENSPSNIHQESSTNQSRPTSPTINNALEPNNSELILQILHTLTSDIKSLQTTVQDQREEMREYFNRLTELKDTQQHQAQTINQLGIQCDDLKTKMESQTQNLKHEIQNQIQNVEVRIHHQMECLNNQIKQETEELINQNKREQSCTKELQEIEDKLNNKLEKLEGYVNVNITRPAKGVQTIHDQENSDTKPTNIVQQGLSINCDQHHHCLDNNVPKFNGRAVNPMEFLTRSTEYINQNGLSNLNRLHSTINNMLEGSANQWWQVIRHEVQTLEDFKAIFEEKYWGEIAQSETRRKIQTGKYVTTGRMSRSEYFIEKVLIMKNLTPKLTDLEIIKQLSTHFEKNVRDAVRVRGIRSIREMETLLNEEDIEDKIDTNKANRTQNNREQINNTTTGNQRPNYNRNNQNDRDYHRPNNNYRPNYDRPREFNRVGDRYNTNETRADIHAIQAHNNNDNEHLN